MAQVMHGSGPGASVAGRGAAMADGVAGGVAGGRCGA